MVANLVGLVWWEIKTSQLERRRNRGSTVYLSGLFKNLPGFIYTNFFFSRGTFVDYRSFRLYLLEIWAIYTEFLPSSQTIPALPTASNARSKEKKTFYSCKTKYKMSPSSVRSEGGEAAAGYCLNSVSYRVDEAVKYNVLNSD